MNSNPRNPVHYAETFSSIAALGGQVGKAIEKHLELAFREVMHGPLVVSERRFVRLVTGEQHPLGNLAVISDPYDLESTTAAIAPLTTCGAPAAVLFPGSVGGQVDEYLRNQGFAAQPPLPAMAVEIEKLGATKLPSGYELIRVGGGKEGQAWVQTLALGYELPLAVAQAFSPEAGGGNMSPDARVQFLAIRKDARFVCTSMLYLKNGLAGVYNVATVPEERGKGLGAHATAEPLRCVYKIGYRVGVLQSSPAGYSVYRRLGFADFGAVPLYVRAHA